METITTWKELTANTINEMGRTIMEAVPNIFGAVLILLIGWLITKIIILVLKRVLKFVKADKWTNALNEKVLSGKTSLKFDISKVILIFVKWILFLVFLIAAADIMKWEIVSQEVGNLMHYLPKLFSAIAVFMVGLYIANFVKKAIKGVFDSFDLRGAKLVSTLVFYIIAFIITVTALNQAGIETVIIRNNTTLILGGFVAAVAISFGLGSKDIVKDIIRTSYARKKFKIGQKVTYKNVSGTIEALESLTMDIRTEQGLLVVPIHKIMEEEILVTEDSK
ncbi:mechanosensitive ion channel family protein [Maribacter sp. ACAM166]|uniref:mechanosensitive ion channel family protein n=1 Tax=Maribacter sp. ACAM166 TaxID=2508996 RepID=UPI0010FCDE83|nr:mechanosensitive ion channel domain-containing protein [Maribacter sp. ACAM166]TLP80132.1 mechanosensitive ion channel [Maribacter sp. ACAM166]